MPNSAVVYEHIKGILPPPQFAKHSSTGIEVATKSENSEHVRIIDVWQSDRGIWYWRPYFLVNNMPRKGYIFDMMDAVRQASSAAQGSTAWSSFAWVD